MNIQVKSAELPPFKPLPQKAPDIEVVRKPDGTVYLSSRHPLGDDAPLDRASASSSARRRIPNAISSPSARRCPAASTGDWRFITYGEMNARADAIAQALLDARLGAGHAADGAVRQFDRACRR